MQNRVVRAVGGSELSCKGWMQEAALRMLHTNLDPEVAENPAELVVYGGTGKAAGCDRAFEIEGFVPRYIRPLFCQGKGPVRWVVLSRDPEGIRVTDDAVMAAMAHDEALCHWIKLARERVAFQGLPSRICWLGYGDRARIGKIFNDLVRDGKVKAPIVIGRDHGMGMSLHACMVVVADETADTEARLERVLTRDPGMGVVRHADAGYPEAIACAEEH